MKIKEILTNVGASTARPSSKARPHTKTILITLPILLLLIAALITLGITNAANNTTPQNTQTFTEDGDGYYIWVRAVDHAGNKGPWSEAQRIWIDTKPPQIELVTSEIAIITEGDSFDISGFFNIIENGSAPYTVEYKVNGNDITNTSELVASDVEYEIICTVTKQTNATASATKKVKVEKIGPELVASATTIQNETKTYQDANGNKIVVPGGFKVLTDLATTVDKGIVIEDSTGTNQFVWVPIGEITKSNGQQVNIEFGRYNFDTSHDVPEQYAKDDGWNATVTFNTYSEVPTTTGTNRDSQFDAHYANDNATALNMERFITTSITNGGYYIARYEASFGSGDKISSVTSGSHGGGVAAVTNQIPQFCKSSSASSNSIGTITSTTGMLWRNIRQGDASLACRNLYAGAEYNAQDFVQCDLINSYAWDTAIVFIEKCSDNSTYANYSTGNTTLTNTGETTDNPCNIYDMAGNLSEWSTEYSSMSSGSYYAPCVGRGANYSTGGNTLSRSQLVASMGFEQMGFRGVLYCEPPPEDIDNSVEIEYTKETFTTAGTYMWTAPDGVNKIQLTIAGAGGGGGGR